MSPDLASAVWKTTVEGAGSVVERWLADVRQRRSSSSLLVVCGAGVSMGGPMPGVGGDRLCDLVVRNLRARSIGIPEEITGNLGQVEDHVVYPEGVFSEEGNEHFLSSLPGQGIGNYFDGQPSREHVSLVTEASACDGRLRIYSINVDSFFRTAQALSSDECPDVRVVNAAELVGRDLALEPAARDWVVLSAHGEILRVPLCVWSDRVLGNEDIYTDDAWSREKEILRVASFCLERAAPFSHVIFSGVRYPLAYLARALIGHLAPNSPWLWINPSERPWRWLRLQPPFKGNGTWAPARMEDVLTAVFFTQYDTWFSCAARCDTGSLPLLQRSRICQSALVQSVDRARRIYDRAADGFTYLPGNTQVLEWLDDQTQHYPLSRLDRAGEYPDEPLARAILILDEHGVLLTGRPDWDSPRLTVALRSGCSVSIFVAPHMAVEDLAKRLLWLLAGRRLAEGHHHILLLTKLSRDLARALEVEVSRLIDGVYPRRDLSISVLSCEDIGDRLGPCLRKPATAGGGTQHG